MSRLSVVALMFLGLAVVPAAADEVADLTRQALESGQSRSAAATLADRIASNPADNQARFGLGMIRFAQAIERFGQRQYKFGARVPRFSMLPILRLPIPANPEPEPIGYEDQRGNLKALLADLLNAEATLAPMTDSRTEIVIDLDKVKFDFRGDGKPDDTESIGAILAAMRGSWPHAPTAPDTQAIEVKFDNSDALWLRGYCHLLAASLEFALAYDWRVTFERAGQLFYPRIRNAASPEVIPRDARAQNAFGEAPLIADLVVFIHEIRWALVEPDRLKAAHAHLKQVTALSRATWKSILAETSDDREWIPGPQQKNGVVTSMPVTRQEVDAWLSALDDFDAALDGTKLVGHWRYALGFNLKRVFLEPRDFDLVLWVTGLGAAPFLEAGPTLSSADWAKWNQAFRGHFLGYALWFN